jgi:hypothetical protein
MHFETVQDLLFGKIVILNEKAEKKNLILKNNREKNAQPL